VKTTHNKSTHSLRAQGYASLDSHCC